MIASTFKKTSLLVLSVLTLCSCLGNSVPQKGYKKYKDLIYSLADANGISKKAVKFSSCTYVWITGDGTKAAGNLKDCVVYQIYGSINVATYTPFLSYVIYSDLDGSVAELDDSEIYDDARTLVNAGVFAGKTGTL